jgi:hypothetical protein
MFWKELERVPAAADIVQSDVWSISGQEAMIMEQILRRIIDRFFMDDGFLYGKSWLVF